MNNALTILLLFTLLRLADFMRRVHRYMATDGEEFPDDITLVLHISTAMLAICGAFFVDSVILLFGGFVEYVLLTTYCFVCAGYDWYQSRRRRDIY